MPPIAYNTFPMAHHPRPVPLGELNHSGERVGKEQVYNLGI